MDSYSNLLVAWFVLCVAAGFYLLFKTAPYGRYLRDGWGVQVPSRLGWILFESPPVFLMIVFFILYSDQSWVQIIFLSIWLSHYINRSLIWPLKVKISGKPMPLLIILFASNTHRLTLTSIKVKLIQNYVGIRFAINYSLVILISLKLQEAQKPATTTVLPPDNLNSAKKIV